MTPELAVEIVDLKSLTPDPRNARKHGRRNLDAIAASLREFGQRRPLVVTHAGVVIAGNGTLEAAASLGWKAIAITRTPQEWTDDQAKAYALADNRTAELAEWDADTLSGQLLELDGAGFDMTALGFELKDMNGDIEVEEDTPPDLREEPRVKVGEIWQLGQHRLICGDATSKTDMAALMDGRQADCIITDPPYNVAYVGGTKDALTIANDSMTELEFARFLNTSYARMFEHARPGAGIYVFHADSAGDTFRIEMKAAGWLLKQCLIWVKNTFVMGRQDYHWQHEPILYGWKPGASHSWHGPRTRATVIDDERDLATYKKQDLVDALREIREASTIIREDKPNRNAQHPTMKPVRLIARLMQNSTVRTDLVLDPFGGSGSTLMAAEQMGRTCYTSELDPVYATVIIDRWEHLTGGTARRVDTNGEG